MLNARVELEKDLRAAIALNQFQLHYQLQIDNKGYAIGAELLIRWLHPERGRVMPSELIPFAEETGLIFNIGMWVLEAACGPLKRWADHPKTHHLRLSLNVSAVQFKQPDFARQVIAEGVRPICSMLFWQITGAFFFSVMCLADRFRLRNSKTRCCCESDARPLGCLQYQQSTA